MVDVPTLTFGFDQRILYTSFIQFERTLSKASRLNRGDVENSYYVNEEQTGE